tara:strand:- start:41 stop:682 length:642 start_codon:yes stop_codon:yes gene_type:complete
MTNINFNHLRPLALSNTNTQPYDFSNCSDADIGPLIHTIGTLGKDLVGLELGVFTGTSFLTLLHSLPNIKTLHGIDNYKPYGDCIGQPYTGTPFYSVDQKDSEVHRFTAFHRIEHSGMKEKVVFHEMDSSEALKKFEPESLDFIFLDDYMSYEQIVDEVRSWYPIVKNGGLFSGHDWGIAITRKGVSEVRDEVEPDAVITGYNDCWSWIKNKK